MTKMNNEKHENNIRETCDAFGALADMHKAGGLYHGIAQHLNRWDFDDLIFQSDAHATSHNVPADVKAFFVKHLGPFEGPRAAVNYFIRPKTTTTQLYITPTLRNAIYSFWWRMSDEGVDYWEIIYNEEIK